MSELQSTVSDARGRHCIRAALFVVACAGLWSCTTAPEPAATPLPGHPVSSARQAALPGTVVRVIDGDTIEVQLGSGPVRVWLHSIDTPEHDQPWGAEARAALAGRVTGRQVDLEPVAQDRYDRLVAVVFLGSENVNAWMVRQGDAWAYRDYIEDPRYCEWEAAARASGRGLWSLPAGSRVAPWEWRAAGRGSTAGFTDYSSETVANCIARMNRRTGSPRN